MDQIYNILTIDMRIINSFTQFNRVKHNSLPLSQQVSHIVIVFRMFVSELPTNDFLSACPKILSQTHVNCAKSIRSVY